MTAAEGVPQGYRYYCIPKLESSMNQIANCLEKWKFSINHTKTEIVNLGRRNQPQNLVQFGCNLPRHNVPSTT